MRNLTALFQTLCDRYHTLSATDNYIFGYTYKGVVYASITKADVLTTICKLGKASSKCGGGYSLRYRPNNKQKEFLMAYGDTFVVCSADHFNILYANSKYNRGEIFEKLVTEHYGQVWTKDNVAFTLDGDLTVGDVKYQIKYEKATFCTESIL